LRSPRLCFPAPSRKLGGYPASVDVFEQLLKSRAVEVSAGEAAVIVMSRNQGPAEMLLADDVRFGGLTLGMERIKILIEALLG
jgi:hypothetical protein